MNQNFYYPCSPIEIRDGTFNRIKNIPEFATVYKARTQPTMANEDESQLPSAQVLLMGEEGISDSPNGGAPNFHHRLKFIVQVIARSGSEDDLDVLIHTLVYDCISTLLEDATWHELFEGLEKFDTNFIYPHERSDYICIGEIQIEVTYRSIWNPRTPHDFASVGVQAPLSKDKYSESVFADFEIPKD